MTISKVVLTGASGFIGSALLPLLLEKGYEVHAFSSKKRTGSRYWHTIDLMDTRQVARALRTLRPSHLVHLAWYTTPPDYWHTLTSSAWVDASFKLAHAFYEAGGKKMVVAGSCAEYAWGDPLLSETSSPFIPATLYGAAKRSFYLMLRAFCEKNGLDFAWGYLFFLYGPKEHPSRLIPTLMQSALKHEPALCGEKTLIRDFLYVKDGARALLALMEASACGAFNIGSGRALSLEEIALHIGALTQTPLRCRLRARSPQTKEPHQILPDTRRLLTTLNWKPRYCLRQGLEETLEWWRRNL